MRNTGRIALFLLLGLALLFSIACTEQNPSPAASPPDVSGQVSAVTPESNEVTDPEIMAPSDEGETADDGEKADSFEDEDDPFGDEFGDELEVGQETLKLLAPIPCNLPKFPKN